jgi:hypothetical protein
MNEVEKLLKQIHEEVTLEKQYGRVRVAPTAPSNFTDTEDMMLAKKFHSLFDLPVTTVISPQTSEDLDEISQRIKQLSESSSTKTQPQTEPVKSTPDTPSNITDPHLIELWKQFNLSDVPNEELDESDEFDPYDFDEDDSDFVHHLKDIIKK